MAGRILNGVNAFFHTAFGAALIGGLVVGVLGWIAIAAGWIESGGDDGSPLDAPPLTRTARSRGWAQRAGR